ncbi:restriction endonuclease subunit S [Variovorax sp. RB2P76]|uniref:restriction endonuclease subunit S n=1 Tax=Variovorax sp. RB2P76 TaxID=3443736 RepID=UPI003F453387
MKALPLGWVVSSVGDLIELKYGKALPERVRSGSGFPVFGSNGIVGWHSSPLTSGPSIVIGRKGSVGEINFSVEPCSPIDTTYYVNEVPGGQFRYWAYALRALQLTELNKSTAIPGLSRSDVYPLRLALPPLPEQQRIADKLDTVLARVDACRGRLARVASLLKRFRQSVLAAATTGRLTEDWRKEKGMVSGEQEVALGDDELALPSTWDVRALSDVIDPARPLCYGVVQPGDERRGGVPLIRVQDMERATILFNAMRTVSKNVDAEYKRSRVKGGDVLISVVGTIGRTAIVPPSFEGNIARAVARIAVRPSIAASWINVWLSSSPVQWWLASSSREVARKTLNLSELAALNVALPDLEEQKKICERVETLFAFADRLEARLSQAQTAVDRLTPALLAKAFRGELVPQDAADEEAGVLLQRIAAQPAEPPARRGRPRRAASVA